MYLKDSLRLIGEYFIISIEQVRKIYLNSSIYNNKISKTESGSLIYKPNVSILNCIIKYNKTRNKIEDLDIDELWEKESLLNKNLKKIHNFYWLFTIDLKSSNLTLQKIVEKWIDKYQNYNSNNWQIDILSKRVISWISNSKLTYEEAENAYKSKFDKIINKQINHLIIEISRSKNVDDKMIGCAAIILGGLSYNNSKFLTFGLGLLKKIIRDSFDNNYFPKSRSIRQLIFYLKYFILIRELLKDSLNEIPEYLDEIIFYLGKSFDLLAGKEESFLFNGNHISNLNDFKVYLKDQKYTFKNDKSENGGYVVLNDKNSIICMDIGSTPNKKYSENFQSGTLSFEYIYKGEKLLCNCGYFQNHKKRLNLLSKSSAAHNNLVINNHSACSFNTKSNKKSYLSNFIKTSNKNIIFEKNFWSIKSCHDGYTKKYGIMHERIINFYPESFKIIGTERLIGKKKKNAVPFDIRFHFLPTTKLTKTQDDKTILIELVNSGWKFSTNFGRINIESGLYFGNKNKSEDNQNICISGYSNKEDQDIKWEFVKI